MFENLAFIVLFSLLFYSGMSTRNLFVTPVSSCGSKCNGDKGQPFDNLLYALSSAAQPTQPTQDSIIYILYDSSKPHYILQKETDIGSNFIYQIPEDISYKLRNVTIKPLFCDDNIVLENPDMLTKCIPRGQKITMFFKTTMFSIEVIENVQIENIIFNAVEDINIWNSRKSPQLESCIYKKVRCCEEKKINSFITPLVCRSSKTDYTDLNIFPKGSLFTLNSLTSSVTKIRSLRLINVEFRNFESPRLKSMIQIGDYPFELVLKDVVLDNIFFNNGVISHTQDSVNTRNVSSITLENVAFSNYNDRGLFLINQGRGEGYLFFANYYFYGNFKIQNSSFTNITTATRYDCFSLRKVNYVFPMTNTLESQPYSRSDLWRLYHEDHRKITNMSSLIYIKKINGTVSISKSTFANIIGTSGSAIRIDDVVYSGNPVTISESKFDNNFAYDGFSNIRIAKESGSGFSSIIECPTIEITSSQFLNARGCPGSYGNVLLLCYWDSQPPEKLSLSNYNMPPGNSELGEWLAKASQKSYIRVSDSRFEGNRLSVCNSLSIIGAHTIFLERNTFKDNGGNSLELFEQSTIDSYFLQKYPNEFDLRDLDSDTHFGQSTAVLLDYVIRLFSNNNTYQGNFGPFEGSLVLASSLTIKNVIELKDKGIRFENDIFTEHHGVPPSVALKKLNDFFQNNYVIPSIVTISIERGASQFITEDIQAGLGIYMDGVKFKKNTVQFDYDVNITNSRGNGVISDPMRTSNHLSTGLIRLLTSSEALDIYSDILIPDNYDNRIRTFTFINGEISDNKLLKHNAGGCLLSTLWATNVNLHNVIIKGNTQYKEIQADTPHTLPSLESPIEENGKHGIFCIFNEESFDTKAKTNLVANNLQVENNVAILFNIYPENIASLFLTNSVLKNNTCNTSALIKGSEDSVEIISISNVFLNNYGKLGNFFLSNEISYQGIFNLYFANDGNLASIIYSQSTLTRKHTEVAAKAHLNTITPSVEIREDGVTPGGALFYLHKSSFIILNSDFRSNIAYSGITTSIASTLDFLSNTVNDHTIIGASLLGTFTSLSTLNMQDNKFVNNSISIDASIATRQAGIVLLFTSSFDIKNLLISGGNTGQGSVLFSATNAKGSIENIVIENFHASKNQNMALISLVLSQVSIKQMTCNDISNLFYMFKSNVYLESVSIEKLKVSSGSQTMLDMTDTIIKIQDLKYIGNGGTNALYPLITGESNYIQIINPHFTNVINRANKVFNLINSEFFFISGGIFEYSIGNTMALFDMTSINIVIIQKNMFRGVSKIVRADNIQDGFSFVSNNILTSSNGEVISLESTGVTSIISNYILRIFSINNELVSDFLVQIINPVGAVKMQANIFTSVETQSSVIGLKSQNTTPYNANLTENLFINNKGSKGGVLYLYAEGNTDNKKNPTAMIRNSYFILNKAQAIEEGSGKGGALYVTTPDETKQDTILIKNYFIGNSADRIGGAIFFDFEMPQIDDLSVFFENFANRPNHIGTYPQRLIFMNNEDAFNILYVPTDKRSRNLATDQDQTVLKDIPSGVKNDMDYTFGLIDRFGQLVYDDNASLLTIIPNSLSQEDMNYFYIGLPITAQSGLYKLKDSVFNYNIGESISIKLSSTAVPNFKKPPSKIQFTKSIKAIMSFRLCGLGQHTVQKGNFLICQECNSGTLQLEINHRSPVCTACDSSSTVCLGGNRVAPSPGYWRWNETADLFLECPLKGTCIESPDLLAGSNTVCAPTYTGNLCYKCAQGLAKGDDYKCINCQTDLKYLIAPILTFLVQVVMIGLMIMWTKTIIESYTLNQSLKDNVIVIFRIVINYLQIVSIIAATNINWPSFLSIPLAIYSRLSSVNEQFAFLECLFTQISTTTIFAKTTTIIVSPLAFIGITLAILTLLVYTNKKRFSNQFWPRLKATVVIIYLVTFQSSLKAMLSLLKCTNLYREDNPKYFLDADYDVQCWTGDHMLWVIGLGVYTSLYCGFGIFFLVLILKKIKQALNENKLVPEFAYFYLGYKEKMYYWELVMLATKVLLVASLVFAKLYSYILQISLLIWILLVTFILHIVLDPYSDRQLNRLDKMSLISCISLAICTIVFKLIRSSQGLDEWLAIIGLSATLCFFVCLIVLSIVILVKKSRLESPRNENELNRQKALDFSKEKDRQGGDTYLIEQSSHRFPIKERDITSVERQKSIYMESRRAESHYDIHIPNSYNLEEDPKKTNKKVTDSNHIYPERTDLSEELEKSNKIGDETFSRASDQNFDNVWPNSAGINSVPQLSVQNLKRHVMRTMPNEIQNKAIRIGYGGPRAEKANKILSSDVLKSGSLKSEKVNEGGLEDLPPLERSNLFKEEEKEEEGDDNTFSRNLEEVSEYIENPEELDQLPERVNLEQISSNKPGFRFVNNILGREAQINKINRYITRKASKHFEWEKNEERPFESVNSNSDIYVDRENSPEHEIEPPTIMSEFMDTEKRCEKEVHNNKEPELSKETDGVVRIESQNIST